MEQYNELDQWDKQKVDYLVNHVGLDLEEALEHFEEVYVYDGDLSDVAAQLVDEGIFGDIPDSIANYIDYEAIGRDLQHDGYHYIAEEHTTYCYQ